MNPNLTDEEIQARLAGDSVRGPRAFRSRPLAPISRGLRDLRNKIVAADDTAAFHDVALLHLLSEAHSNSESGRLEKRRALIMATDDVATFRATVSLLMDALSDEEIATARQVTNEILGLVEQAEVTLQKKSETADPQEPSPTTTPLPSCPSPATPDGAPISSVGS